MLYGANVPVEPSIPLWLQIVTLIVGTLLGGGGLAAVMKARYDRKQGIETNEIVEDDAIVERWKQLSQAQIEMLLNPLKQRLAEVETAVSTLEAELGKSRTKYWIAIPYIRRLRNAFDVHAPDAPKPTVPVEIAEDVGT